MANQKISQFTYTDVITGNELIGVAIDGQNKAISTGTILDYADKSAKMGMFATDIENLQKGLLQQEISRELLETRVNGMDSSISYLEDSTNNLVSSINDTISEITGQLTSYIDQIQTNARNISHIESDMIAIDRDINSVKKQITYNTELGEQHTTDIINLHDMINDLQNSVNGYDINGTHVNGALDNINEIKDILAAQAESNTGIESRVSYLETTVSYNCANIVALNDIAVSYGDLLTSHSSKIEALENTTENLTAYSNTLGGMIDELSTSYSTLNDSVSKYFEKNDENVQSLSYICEQLEYNMSYVTYIVAHVEEHTAYMEAQHQRMKSEIAQATSTAIKCMNAVTLFHDALEEHIENYNTTLTNVSDVVNRLAYMIHNVDVQVDANSDMIDHITFHESHPETSMWSVWGNEDDNCGYEPDPCLPEDEWKPANYDAQPAMERIEF